jgi:hypothetical protein
MSGNTFGARVWTDGKQVAPMLPRPPAVVKCRHCQECYWLSEAEEVGVVDQWSEGGKQVDPAWATAAEVLEPTEGEYHRALASGLATTPEQERNLRVLAWWRSNDAFRGDPAVHVRRATRGSAKRRENLEVLARLLDEGDESDCLMKAEVLRELGKFEAAKQILSRVGSSEVAAVVRQLRSLCDAEDTYVRELHSAE